MHRRDKLRSEKIMQDKVFEKEKAGKVTIKWNSTLDEILGDKSGVTGMRIKHTQTGSAEDIPLDGVFIAIGHKPNTDLFVGQLDLENGYIVTQGGNKGNATQTSITGVFAAGDVQDHIYRQAYLLQAQVAWPHWMRSVISINWQGKDFPTATRRAQRNS